MEDIKDQDGTHLQVEHPGPNFSNFLEQDTNNQQSPEKHQMQIVEETPIVKEPIVKEPVVEEIQRKEEPVKTGEEPTAELQQNLEVAHPEQEFPKIPTASEHTRMRKMSQLVGTAFKQRKDINRNEFAALIKRRTQYYQKHVSVYDNLTFSLLQKMKETAEYMPSLIKFCNQMSDMYKSFQEHSRKISAFKFLTEVPDAKKPDPRLSWSDQINKGVKAVLELKDETANRMKTMENSIQTSIVPLLEKALYDYTKRLEHANKLCEKQKSRYLDEQAELLKKVKKVNKILTEEQNQKDKKDGLVGELIVFSYFTKAHHQLKEWGNLLTNWWTECISAQKLLVSEIKSSLLKLIELYQQMHGRYERTVICQDIWKNLDINYDVDKKMSLGALLPVSHLDFIKITLINMYGRDTKQYPLEDWKMFCSQENEQKLLSDRKAIINSLVLKRFEGELANKTKISIVSTVDDFLVLFDESSFHCHNKMQLKRLMNVRKTDYEVSINEKIEGFLMDSWNKETVQFKNPDAAEQFMFYTENSAQVKKEYTVS